ncbi:MAG: hypothetical protein WBM59_10815, partial [Sedimenticolaceae bacterium]
REVFCSFENSRKGVWLIEKLCSENTSSPCATTQVIFVKNPHFFLLLQKYDDRRTGKHLI